MILCTPQNFYPSNFRELSYLEDISLYPSKCLRASLPQIFESFFLLQNLERFIYLKRLNIFLPQTFDILDFNSNIRDISPPQTQQFLSHFKLKLTRAFCTLNVEIPEKQLHIQCFWTCQFVVNKRKSFLTYIISSFVRQCAPKQMKHIEKVTIIMYIFY